MKTATRSGPSAKCSRSATGSRSSLRPSSTSGLTARSPRRGSGTGSASAWRGSRPTTEQDRRAIASIRERYKKSGREIPEATQKIFKLTDDRAAAAEAFLKKHGLGEPEQIRGAAIMYCLSRPDVHCVCPSINTFEDLDAYLPLSGGRFEASDAEMLADCREVYGDLTCRIGCGECEPACPRGVPIAAIMRYKYYFRNLGREKAAMTDYAALAGRDARLCEGCDGPCEKACPHGVPIPGLLALTHDLLTLG